MAPVLRAHNLDTRATGISFEKSFVATMTTRASTNAANLVQVGDEFWVILKTTPGPGTVTGVGGYQTFYVPSGVQVTGAEIIEPDPANPGSFRTIPAHGQSIIAVGAGTIGAKASLKLLTNGVNGAGMVLTNFLGRSEKSVVDATGIARGTIAGVYADTGIFYSTNASTAFNSYNNPTNSSMVNNSGDTVGEYDAANVTGSDVLGVMTLWDSYQLRGFGRKDVIAIIDPVDQRGNAPWGMASAVAGPQSGYPWSFDYNAYTNASPTSGRTAAQEAAAVMTGIVQGPWLRIQYPGSQVSSDLAGSSLATLGYAGVDGSSYGVALSSGSPLPTTTTAVRFAIGMLELGRPLYARVRIKILTAPSTSCFTMYADAFGGDAGGEQGGKDHIWRYFDPTVVQLSACLALQKVASVSTVAPNGTLYFDLTFANNSSASMPNVTLTDTLPSGLAHISSVPIQNSGPNPLVYNLGTVPAGQIRTVRVNVQATGTGTQVNEVSASTNNVVVATADETVEIGLRSLLSETKTVTPSSIAPGGTNTYTITVSNDGNTANGSPLLLNELLPAGFTYDSLVSVDLNGGTPGPGVVSVNATNPNRPVFTVSQGINPGKTLVLKFKVVVASTVTPGTYCNQVNLNFESKTVSGVPEACVTVTTGGIIGDTVFLDSNANGVQDSGEPGIAGVTVTLSGAASGTAVTDANGKYLFTGLAAGSYSVDVPAAGAGGVPAGYVLTTANDPTSVTLAANEVRLNVDFGFRASATTGSIGDQMFYDVNNNGAYNAGTDSPLPNVTVRLYASNGTTLLATTTTDANGLYTFSGLAAATYVVKVDLTDPDIASNLTSTVALGTTSSIVLTSGQNRTDIDFPFTDSAFLAKTVNFSTARAATNLTYTLSPVHPGPGLLSGVIIADTVPTGATYVSSGQGGTFSSPTVSWSLGTNTAASNGSTSVSSGSSTIAFVASNTATDRASAGVTNLTVTKPAGTASNNVMVAAVSWRNGSLRTLTVPAGWTQIGTNAYSTTSHGEAAFYKVAGGSEPASYTFTINTNTAERWSVGIATFTNVDNTTPVDAQGQRVNASSTSVTAPAVTPSVANTMLVAIFATKNGTSSGSTVTVPGTMTERFDVSTQAGGTGEGGLALATEALGGATNSLTRVATAVAATVNIGHLIALKPAGVSYTVTTALATDRRLVTSNGVVTVTLTATATGNAGTVTPPTNLGVTAVNSAAATKLTGPTPASASLNNASTTFTYTYRVDSGADPGSVAFTATPTDSNGTWAQGTSPTVLVTPPLTFIASVDSVPGVGVVTNTGRFTNNNTLLYTTPPVLTTLYGAIGDTLFYDTDGNGTQNGGELGITNQLVTLYNDADNSGSFTPGDTALATTTTDSNGNYLFTDLVAGNYIVTVEEQSVLAPTGSANAGLPGFMVATTGTKKAITLAPAGVNLTADFGFIERGLLEGTTFWDVNHSGIFDAPDAARAAITVWLDTDNDGVLDWVDGNANNLWDAGEGEQWVATNASGEYKFLVAPGSYNVRYDSADPQWAANNIGTGGEQTTPGSYSVTVAAGQEVSHLDFGRDNSGRIGDTIFADLNSNGSQGAGEPGLQGVTVNLYTNPNGSAGIDGDEVFVESQVTDANGNYLFVGLADANYQVRVDTTATSLPSAFSATPTAEKDGTFNSVNAAVISGGNSVLDLDFGYPLAPPASYSVSGTVWHDQDGDAVIDANGIENATFVGMTVRAEIDLDQDGTPDYTLTTTTGAAGAYSFTGIPSGSNVRILVDETTLPSPGYSRTADPDVSNGQTLVLNGQTLITNLTANKTGQDFGYKGVIRVGNRIWNDNGAGGGTANDGLINGTEPGIDGVSVQVYAADTDGNPTGSVLATTTTAGGGYYGFYLNPGDYVIVVPASNFGSGQPLNGLFSSGTSTGTFNGIDPDATPTDNDDNGFNAINPSSTGVRTAAFTLTVGGEPTGETAVTALDILAQSSADSSVNLTVDLGFVASSPTAIKLAYLKGWWAAGKVTVEWETVSEMNTLGFDLYRLTGGVRVLVNADLVPALNVERGGVYRLNEPMARPSSTVSYILVEQETTGRQLEYGPFDIVVAPPAQVTSVRLAPTALEMLFTGEPGTEYLIETTDDMVAGRWIPAGQFKSDPSGVILFHQPLNGTEPARFYRALRP